MNRNVKVLRDPESRQDMDQVSLTNPAGMHELEDSALSSITGGCNPNCGGGTGPTTWLWSCTTGPCP